MRCLWQLLFSIMSFYSEIFLLPCESCQQYGHMMYPAPYSQSWDLDSMPVVMKKNILGGPRGPKTKKPGDSQRTWSQQFLDRPDPTAPHLKYGVFRNRRGPEPRPLMPKPERQQKMERLSRDVLPKKQTKFKRSTEPVIRVPQEPTYSNSSSSSAMHVKSVKKQETSRYHPVIMTRTIHESYCRKLCLSNIMHLDIKPKKFDTYNSPTFCPSPYYKGLPRLAVSPVRKRNMRDPIQAIPLAVYKSKKIHPSIGTNVSKKRNT